MPDRSTRHRTVLEAALELAADGLAVLPCCANKRPACLRGFKGAARDPDAVRRLWRDDPGPLIGVATGAASDLAALDLDAKHPEARAWWAANRERLPATRAHRTRSGGLHLLFRHAPGLRCSAGRFALGVDVRADGGYLIWWAAAALPVLSDALRAPWPVWLLAALEAPPRAPLPQFTCDAAGGERARAYAMGALRDAVAHVACAGEGARNTLLNAEAFALMRFVRDGALGAGEVAYALAIAARHAGLPPREAASTLASAIRAGGAA